LTWQAIQTGGDNSLSDCPARRRKLDMAKLLVVDDESNIRLLYSQELSDEGHQVVTAASATEAVEKLAAGDYDLVVLDIKLKNESGLDLLQKIVKERHDMPVILSTAFSCYKDDFSAWLADGYVVKSSDPQELKDEINRVLAKKAGRGRGKE
jgi:DNA-binding NtrC family response regulator